MRLTGAQRLKEAAILISAGFAFFLLIALGTFHPGDPGWSQFGLQPSVQNWMGVIGAWMSDLLYFGFGYLAFVVPFVIVAITWFVLLHAKPLSELDFMAIGLRLIGGVLLFTGASGIFSINVDDFFSFSSGGVLGEIISSALIPYFNLAGTILLMLCFVCTGFTLLTGISWALVVDNIGAVAISATLRLLKVTNKSFWRDLFDSLPKWQFKVPANKKVQQADEEITHQSPVAEQTKIEPVIEPSILSKPQNNAHTFSITELQQKVQPQEIPEGDLPSFELLEKAQGTEFPISQEELDQISRLVESKLADFNISADVVGVYPGPVITRFELDLAPGVKVAKIAALSKDLARSLSAMSVRVVEVIPGKSVIGLELPNKHREMVRFSEVISSKAFADSKSSLAMVLGADISGEPVVVDLAKMPHLLVAGTTGSGKSVGVNVMILSLLYKSTPEDVRMIMIDPKMLELSVYEGIPHLLSEVVTDMKEAANALRWCVGEMERRYKLMSALGVRNLKGYNAKISEALEKGEPILDPLWKAEDSFDEFPPELGKLPSIVVVVDEFADMMMIVGKKVEELIARIAQKARAAGIHLILATQRPSVDVITGLIKANIPTRIAFQVSSKIDSRTIIDQQGAEALLGMGDMLYLPSGHPVPTRVHGAFVDDHEVHAVVADWKLRGEPEYVDEILNGDAQGEVMLPSEQGEESADQEYDAFYDEAVEFVTETRRASISSVQRKFRIGYNRAARLVEQMEQNGVVSAQGHNGNREVLAPAPIKD